MNAFGCNPQDYDLKVELAKCCFGLATVYLAKYMRNGQHVAVKKYSLDKATKEETAMMHEEILMLRQFSHVNLHTFHTAFVSGNELYVVSPLMCFGSCKDTLKNCFNGGFPEILVALVLRDVLTGLEYMHRRGYIHRAIRASHILLNQTKAVLAGFSQATSVIKNGQCVTTLHQLAPFSNSSLNWLAPEMLEQNLNGYTEKSDIYSVGITCCELANGIEPYGDVQPTFMFTEKVRGHVPTLLDSSTCPMHEDMLEMSSSRESSSIALAAQAQQIYSQRVFSDEFHQFSEICLEKHASRRWSALQLLSHSFFKQCRHTNIFQQLQRLGVQTTDYSQVRDDTLAICNQLDDLQMHTEEWNWDF